MFKEKSVRTIIILVSLILLAIALRVLLFYIPSFDITKFVGVWYDTFRKVGRISAFANIFYNYSPAYLYFVDMATLFHFIPKEQSIKLISVLFDFFAAFAGYKIVELRFPKGYSKWLGFFIILFTPTVFIESGMWGQCDIIYTSFLLWSLFFIIKRKNFLSILSFSIAFAFKFQAAFFAPIFIILIIQKKIPIYYLFVIPIIYFISVVPAWIAGGPLVGLLTIYFTQYDTYNRLSMRAPNLYIFLTNTNTVLMIIIGMIITAMIVIAFILLRSLKWKKVDSLSVISDVVFFTTIIPFFLPKMHERYFFAGALFLIILAIYNHIYIWQAILFQATSLLSYIPYFSGWSDDFVRIASLINLFLFSGLVFDFWKYYKNDVTKNPKLDGQTTRRRETEEQFP